ncbi:MAG: GyrI-like domain-containing protein [Chloroflexi bacterium]|nr:GyrI-like domain-containing protein [Chloroflexota bacterium]
MQTWKTLARETVFDHGKFLRVEKHRIELPDGRIIVDWPWVVTPDFVNMMVVTDDEKFLVFRQTKYAVDGISLAPVGGYLEPNEQPLAAAKRELMEETGYVARDWIDLGAYAVDGNRGAGKAHLFLARNARRVNESNADDLEDQELLLLNRSELEAAIAAGEFKLVPWQAVMALGLLQLNQLTKPKEEIMPEIKHFPKRRVAFVSEMGPWPASIQRGFGRLFAWMDQNHVQPLGPSLGIFYDDPAKVAPEKLRSDLCVPVADQVQGSNEVHVKDVGGFEAATIHYQGNANIVPAYNQVYDWLHAQGYHDSGAPIEVYLSKPGEEIRAEIVVPIMKFEKAPSIPEPVVIKKPVKRATKKPVKKTVKKAAKKTGTKSAKKSTKTAKKK